MTSRPSVHYAWVVAGVGMLGVLASLGFGRFALGMLLPSMGGALGLDYARMGTLSTANFLGYLGAVVSAGIVLKAVGARRGIVLGLLLVGGSMVAVGRADGYVAVLILYGVTGIGSGWANVLIMGLVSHWFLRRRRGRAAGIIVSGSGFAIVASGLLVPAVNAAYGAEAGWRVSWTVLGGAVLTVAAVSALLLRGRPTDIGLEPLGRRGEAPPSAAHVPPPAGRWTVPHLAAIYFLFGFTYVIFVTFIVTTMVDEHGFPEMVAGRFWAWVGALSIVSGPAFGMLSDHIGRRGGLAAVFACHAAAYALVAAPLPPPVLYLSIALFGLSAWSIPGIMAAAVGDTMGPDRAVSAFGTVTLAFGVGQVAGPAVAGWLAEANGGFAAAYGLAAGLAGAALLLSLFLRKPHG